MITIKQIHLNSMLFGQILLFSACTSDIAIITTGKDQQDTSYLDDTETIEEPSSPANEPTSETSTDMTELTIGSADLKLHQPTTGGYTDQLTAVGTCVTQEFGSYVSSTPIDIQGAASFNSIQLYPVGAAEWSTSNLQEYQIPRRESITVVTDDGIIPDAFETLEGFDDIQPWELRYVDPSYAFAAVVSKQGTNFSWQPVIQGAQFEIMIVVYSPDGSQLLGLVSCMENDVGYMTVPGNYFQSYPYNALTAIYLSRHRVDRKPALDFNGYLESHMSWTILGTGHIE